jgi:hypothetical protein
LYAIVCKLSRLLPFLSWRQRGLSLPFLAWRVRLRLPTSRPTNEAAICATKPYPESKMLSRCRKQTTQPDQPQLRKTTGRGKSCVNCRAVARQFTQQKESRSALPKAKSTTCSVGFAIKRRIANARHKAVRSLRCELFDALNG